MSTSNPESVAGRVALIVGRLNRRLAAAPGGLSQGLLMALATVSKHGSLRLAELAQLELTSPPGITRVVAELENRGLVTRSVDPDDGRAFRIQITVAGTDAIQHARAARTAVVEQLLLDLSPAEIAEIEAALPALEKAVQLP